MTNLQQLKEEARGEFDKKFYFGGLTPNTMQTIDGFQIKEIKDFIDSLITKAYEDGCKATRKFYRDCDGSGN